MIKPIGGFFGTEPLTATLQANPHASATGFLNTGRACMRLIVQTAKPSLVYLPFYACNSLIEPIEAENVPYKFYSINHNLEIEKLPELKDGELLVYINYFGLKADYCRKLSTLLKRQLVIDATQAYFQTGVRNSFLFNSTRKFFGVPDGAYLYSSATITIPATQNPHISIKHLALRKEGQQEKAFELYQLYEAGINNDVFAGSSYTLNTLSHIDYNNTAANRQRNFELYHQALGSLNALKFNPGKDDVPFCYPFFPTQEIGRNEFYKEEVFIPTLWRDVVDRPASGFIFEKELSKKLLPLPLDQRYSKEEIKFVIDLVLKFIRHAHKG